MQAGGEGKIVRLNVYAYHAGPANYYIHPVRMWDIGMNWNKPQNYLFSQPGEKESLRKIDWEMLTSPIVSPHVIEPTVTAKTLGLL